jgi:predicted amidohydrolase
VLRRRPRGTGIVIAELDRAGQAEKRERFPSLSHRVLE